MPVFGLLLIHVDPAQVAGHSAQIRGVVYRCQPTAANHENPGGVGKDERIVSVTSNAVSFQQQAVSAPTRRQIKHQVVNIAR